MAVLWQEADTWPEGDTWPSAEPGELAGTRGVTARVTKPDGTHIAILPRLVAYEWTDTLSETGNGKVTVPLDDERVTDEVIADGNLVELTHLDATRFAFRIQPPTGFTTIDPDESQRTLELSGDGILTLLDDALVYPERGIERFNPSDRPFNWIASSFREEPPSDHPGETWSTPQSWGTQANPDNPEWAGYPEGFPDPDAVWVWPTKPADLNAAPGDAYFRQEVVLSEAKEVGFYASGDDEIEFNWDGEQLINTSGTFQWQRTFVDKRTVGAGTHQVTVRGRNLERSYGDSPAGVLWSIVELDSNGDPTGAVLARSNTTGSGSTSYTTSGQHSFTVPSGVSEITIEAYGAAGSGLGGKATGTLSVSPGEVYDVYVGGAGGTAGGSGGVNGGGSAGGSDATDGGGGSDFRPSGGALADRLLVAGGGGGASAQPHDGGGGGGTQGEAGAGDGGGGGTQSAGGTGGTNATDGSLGQGGDGGDATIGTNQGGGGGGGYYGGGGGAGAELAEGGGGGGSGFTDASLANPSMATGVETGDGQVTITWGGAVNALGYPDRSPGMTAGDKVQTLVGEAKERGCIPSVTPSFNYLEASNLQLWPSDVDSRVRHLRSLLDVVESMADWQVDVRMHPGQTLDLNGYDQHGSDLTTGNAPVVLRKGRDIRTMRHSRPVKLRNVLVGEAHEGLVERSDASSVSTHGRREAAERLGESDEPATAGDQLDTLLAERKDERLTASATLYTNAHMVPYRDFDLGDLILAPDRKLNDVAYRVISIAARRGEGDEPVFTVELEQQP